LNGDVRDVHRVINIGDVLYWRSDVVAQNRFTDVANLAKIVILRTDIELDVHLRADGSSLINDASTAWRQRRPANVIATSSPRDPRWAPIEVLSGEPDPSIIREVRPAAIMIGGPTEILVRDPCPSVIRISPVTVRVWSPVRIVYSQVGLPTVSVTFNFNPVSAGKIIVKIIDRYVCPGLLKSRCTKRKHS
jgi:hypothetical protein